MKKIISAALVVAMTAVSCANKEDLGNNNAPEQPSADGTMSFSADFAEPISKAAPSYNETSHVANVLWEAQDKVGVYDKDGAPAEFTAQTAGESTTLTGFAQPDVATYYAMYPYDENATISGGIISTSLPAEQKAAAEAFTAHLAVASTEDNSFSFSNVCGLVRIYVGCEHVTKVEFKGNNNEVVAGDIQVNAATAGYENGAATAKTITVLPPADAQTFAEGAYYFSILPQNFQSGFTVTSYTSDGYTEVRKVDDPVNIPRSSLVVGKPFTDISGTGAEDKPFIIKTVHDLCNLSEVLSLTEANYVELENDIDLAGVTEWTPINNNRVVDEIAEIHFDGKNHSILNFGPTDITKNSEGSTNVGIFGILSGGCRNLNVVVKAEGFNTGLSTVGVVCGYAGFNGGTTQLKATFTNVHVSGGPVSGVKVISGFAASSAYAEYTNCSSTVDVTSSDLHVGGFVGRYDDEHVSSKFVRCFTTGDVECTTTKKRFIGGFLGGNTGGTGTTLTFEECYSTGNVTGDYQTGGLIGFIEYGTIEIKNCYSTGNILSHESPTSAKHIGGLIGGTKGTADVTGSYYMGTIHFGKKGSEKDSKGRNESFGGLFGLNSAGTVSIANSFALVDFDLYADAAATSWASRYLGGIIGNNSGTLTVDGCYAQVTAPSSEKVLNVGGILGNTTASATLQGNTYTGVSNVAGVETNITGENNQSVSAYATPSAIATQLGWASVQDDQGNAVWNLTDNAPTLRCFE